MHSTKQKVSDAAAVAKEHVDIMKAKAQEKAEKATARTKGDKEVAHEMRKAKEAEAKMQMHLSKAEHAAEKVHGKYMASHLYSHQQGGAVGAHQAPILGSAVPPTAAAVPAYYPPGTHPPGWTAPK